MSRQQSLHDRMGVYNDLADVPDRRRLYRFASAYEEYDTWADYRATVELGDRMSDEWELFSRRWKQHMDDRGRHHALARPDDVEAWSETLVDRFSVDRAYQHWNVIEGFYEWLMWHTEHRHAYNPFHMAAADPESNTRRIWERKTDKAND